MQTMIKKIKGKYPVNETSIFFLSDVKNIPENIIDSNELMYVSIQHTQQKKDCICLNKLNKWIIFQFFDKKDTDSITHESCRRSGDKLSSFLNEQKIEKVTLIDVEHSGDLILALAEGMALGNYQFIKYKSDKADKQNSLKEINISSKVDDTAILHLNIQIEAVYKCRDLVNEPVAYLNAEKLSELITEMAEETGMKVEVFNKTKIEALKMGGLLAVNKGSIDPPTFSILEWKPKGHTNKKPYVFVGKGVVFDSGGVNIKPGSSMEDMKCDMGGAAAVATAMYAIAKAKLNVHVIGLMPATDNRPDGNSYVPGDVITMYTGKTVEVLNTDAEGRMILADALGYASKYKPELVIDLATLTGAASKAIGIYGIVAMHNDAEKEFGELKDSGANVYERLAEFPFWEEYEELIKSDVADIKNIGGPDAGMITAGKFLANFTDYPYIHLDIAGPVFIGKKDSYRGKAATGVGVRLLFNFVKQKTNKK